MENEEWDISAPLLLEGGVPNGRGGRFYGLLNINTFRYHPTHPSLPSFYRNHSSEKCTST